MPKPMLCVERLAVHRFRGIRSPDDEIVLGSRQLSPGVNLVYGPNGSGKTTLARAISAALWPQRYRRQDPLLEATLRVGDRTAERELIPGRVTVDGENAAWLDSLLPPPEHADRYYFGLHELLQADDAELAAVIQREIHGGLDVKSARESLGFGETVPSPNTGAYRQWQEARQKRRQVEDQQVDLQRREARLAEICAAEKQAGLAGREADALRTRRDYLVTRLELAEAEARLALFDPVCDRLQGDELEQWQALTQQLLDVEQELATGERQLAAAETARQATGLGDDGVSASLLNELDELVRQLDEAERSATGIRERLAEAQAGVGSARASLGAVGEADLEVTVRPGWLERSRELMRELEAARGKTVAAETLDAWLTPSESVSEADAAALTTAIYLLTRWLRARAALGGGKAARLVVPCLMVFSVALVLLFGWLVSPWGWVGLIVPVGLAVAGARGGASTRSAPGAISVEFEGLGVPPPARWGEDEVAKRIDELSERLASVRLDAQRAERQQTIRSERRKLDAEILALEAQRREQATVLGLAPETGEQALYLVTEALGRLQQAAGVVDRQVGALASVTTEIAACLSHLNERAGPHVASQAADAASAHGLLHGLQERSRAFNDASSAANAAREGLAGAARRRDTRQQQVRVLRERTGIGAALTEGPDPFESRLTACLNQLSDFREAQTRARNLAFQGERLGGGEDVPDNAGPDELKFLLTVCEEALATAVQGAGAREALQAERTGIQTLVVEARRRHDLEEALADEAGARESMAALLAQTDAATVGTVLLDHLLLNTQKQASRVLARARELFGLIAQHHYELEVTETDRARFRARDSARNRVLELGELSSGTRVQLLLAVRLAFIEEQEGDGVCLPLLFDEVLANSDDRRAGAVIQAVMMIAAEGRQVFCFSAQEDELGKWRAALVDHPDLAYRAIGLPCRPDGQSFLQIAPLEPSVAPAPAVDGRSHRDYGILLGVPACNPFAGIEPLHLWYLVDSPEVLRRLLDAGYTQWGQLRRLVEAGGEACLVSMAITEDQGLWKKLSGAALLFDAAFRLYRAGRARPLTKGDLADSPLKRSVYLPQIMDCAAGLDWDGAALVRALESHAVKGVGSVQATKLNDYFQDAGLVDARERLSLAEIRIEVDAFAASHREAGGVDAAPVKSRIGIALSTALGQASEAPTHGTV